MVEPELPQSNGESGAQSFKFAPSISIEPFSFRQLTPKVLKQARVLAQSAPVEKFSNFDVPLAMAPSMA
jgi:hypothetical protein